MKLINEDIENYCNKISTQPSELLNSLYEYTQKNIHGAQMLIGPMEGNILKLLIKSKAAKSILEFGTFTGYSSLCMAEAMPKDGQIFTIDIDVKNNEIAKLFWSKSPHGYKINSIIKPGIEAIKDINQNFDLIFIDADKRNYLNYLKWSLEHLNPKGIIITDNTLWSGKVLSDPHDDQTQAIIEHNQYAQNLKGYHKVLLPIRDGMLMMTKD